MTIKENTSTMKRDRLYAVETAQGYPESCKEVLWHGIWMPFDVIKGLDSVPFDEGKTTKRQWWVCPRTKSDVVGVQDISNFIDVPTKEFKTLKQAISFCFKWRREWLKSQLKVK